MNNSSKLAYITSLFLFKLGVGAILLLVAWDTLGFSGSPIFNVTFIMVLSFLPAAFSNPLFKRFRHIKTRNFLTTAYILSALLLPIESLLINHHLSLPLYICHFILWIILFLIDVACEQWFVALSKPLSSEQTQRLTGLSFAIAQLGVILGPLLVILCEPINHYLTYFVITGLFIVAALLAVRAPTLETHHAQQPSSPTPTKAITLPKSAWPYVLGFALVWPTVAIFNISIPLLAKSHAYHSINVAGLLELLVGGSKVIVGFLYARLALHTAVKHRALTAGLTLALAAGVMYIGHGRLSIASVATFLLGSSFGLLRTDLRQQLARQFSPEVAGLVVAQANSWSALFVTVYGALFWLIASYSQQAFSPLFPLAYSVIAIIFTAILLPKNTFSLRRQQANNPST